MLPLLRNGVQTSVRQVANCTAKLHPAPTPNNAAARPSWSLAALAAAGSVALAGTGCSCDNVSAAKSSTPAPGASGLRTVGVLHRDDKLMMRGYTLFSNKKETYLINEDGRVVHEWRSNYDVFGAHLLPNGNLLRSIALPFHLLELLSRKRTPFVAHLRQMTATIIA